MTAETSPDIAKLAAKGLANPLELAPDEIQAVCASALRQAEAEPEPKVTGPSHPSIDPTIVWNQATDGIEITGWAIDSTGSTDNVYVASTRAVAAFLLDRARQIALSTNPNKS